MRHHMPAAEPPCYRGTADSEGVSDALVVLPVATVLGRWLPGSSPQPWSWADEENDIYARVCMCCEQPGHYMEQLEKRVRQEGIDFASAFAPPELAASGVVWDGHHRLILARRLGIENITVNLHGGNTFPGASAEVARTGTC
jgi:hypothetical protein